MAWVGCAVPPWIPVLVVTAGRAAFASNASLWGVLPFTVGVALVGAVVFLLALFFAAMLAMEMLNRDSEEAAGVSAFLLGIAASAIFFVAAFFTPLSWPGPAGEWGRGLASAVGLG
ncbi:hypothetical protein ACSNOK_11750 [Streptomyces sp. URMC 126]|uniref:hypothetical protein n=1 Tax=Streptomyces sp. URMC 126 TaxID=3423401 RepID=UPI003F19E491